MAVVCGIDEAGRGPVIGPMVLCGVIIDEAKEKELFKIGAKDSKLLEQKTRERLSELIKTMVSGYKVVLVSPYEIDRAVQGTESNLNLLEAEVIARIIDELKPDKAIVDCPSPNIGRYREQLRGFMKHKDIELIPEHKADMRHPVVSAASIIAKVRREEEISKLKEKYGIEFGSGYPSDPVTVEFLKKNYGKYDFFRKSWAPYRKVAEGKDQRKLGDF